MSAGASSSSSDCLIFKLNEDGNGPEILKEVLYEKGWVDYDETIHNELQWNLWWKTARFRTSEYDQLFPWQRINHWPKATSITRKDSLARLLKLQQALFGSAYNFVPESFILPNDYRKFVQKFSSGLQSQKKRTADGSQYWICKPADMSRGRGIFIIRELGELQYDTNSVVQQYVSRPYLIHGHKFDLRLYAVVTSYHPLVIYLYNNGLVRFSCEKYDLASLDNMYSHLTNTSINKSSFFYATDKAGIGHGSKWTINQLRHYFHQNRVDDSDLWWRIISIVNLTIIPQMSEVPKVTNCFELYGFDILIDKDLKPWLLEVNFSPALSNDCSTDSVKRDMLSDLIDLLQYKPADLCHGVEPYMRKVSAGAARRRGDRAPDASRTGLLSRRDRGKIRTGTTLTHSTLPRIPGDMCMSSKPRPCYSVTDSSDTAYCSEEENSEYHESTSPSPPLNSILTCSLSNLNLPPSRKSQPHLHMPLLEKSATMLISHREQSKERGLPSRLGNYQTHRKPWRQQPSRLRIQKIVPVEQPAAEKVVGGFHRIFPLNKVTQTKNLSPRQMIVETSQTIRSKLRGSDSRRDSRSAKPDPAAIVNPFPDLSQST